MKEKFQGPVTDENFNEAWEYVNGKLIEIQKKKIIRKVLVFFGNILFLICACVVTYGATYKIVYPSWWEYLLSKKELLGMWSVIMPFVNHPNLHWAVQFIIYLIPVFVISFAGCALVALILWYVLPASAKKEISGDKEADAKVLVRMVKEVEIRGKKVQSIDSLTLPLFYLAFIIALVAGYITSSIENNDTELFVTVLKWIMDTPIIAVDPINMISAVGSVILVLVVLCFGALNVLFANMLKPVYMTKIPEEVLGHVENYYHECTPELKARFEEEEQILERAKEIQSARRKEKEELLAEINYKNPIYNYIKKGIGILILIILIGIGAHYIKSMDLASLLNSWGVESTEIIEE